MNFLNNPEDPEYNSHVINFSVGSTSSVKTSWDAPKKYFRMTPGQERCV